MAAKTEPSYWADSNWENRYAEKISECFELGRQAYKSDEKFHNLYEAIEWLVTISPIKIKAAIKEWENNSENKLLTVDLRTRQPLRIYSIHRDSAIRHLRSKLGFICDRAEEAGLLAKPKLEVRHGYGRIKPPNLERSEEQI